MDLISAQQTVRQPSVEHLDIEDEVTKYLEEERNVLDMQSHLEHVHRLERPAEQAEIFSEEMSAFASSRQELTRQELNGQDLTCQELA